MDEDHIAGGGTAQEEEEEEDNEMTSSPQSPAHMITSCEGEEGKDREVVEKFCKA